MAYDYEKERMEAICAGERARNSLFNALDALNGARGWGIFDILGGGLISTLIKHSKMDAASDYLEDAKADLMVFSRELHDLPEFDNINLSTGDFWGFADWLFDGLLADWIMQERIIEARSQVKGAIQKVEFILNRLKQE